MNLEFSQHDSFKSFLSVDDRTYCPASTGLSYDWVKENDHCYHLFGLNASYWAYQGERTFEEARLYCQAMGGDLMTIESQDEQENVLPQIIPPYSMYKNFWIGLKRKLDAHGEEYPAEYEWVDGTQTDYQHFAGVDIVPCFISIQTIKI